MLRPIPVQQLDQIERVRIVRNECAAGFSYHTAHISEAAQIAWWEKVKPLGWLYADEKSEVVGFGVLRKDDCDRWVTTCAVLPQYGERGYGKWIVHHLVMNVPDQCWATARRDNPAAVKLHVSGDWQIIEGPDPRLVYFRTWPRDGARAEPPEPRDFRFALQPSLRPSFAAESGPDCRVEWRSEANGRLVRVVHWARRPAPVGPSPWRDPASGRELSR